MRPVNLMPPDARRGDAAPSRSGPLPYLLVGALAIAVLAVAMLTLSSNTVSEREAEVASLEQRDAELSARAASLASFVSFQSVAEARTQTIATLAESRFDWERVMRELSLVLPERVWLVNLTGTVAPDVQVPNGAGNPLRAEAAGPALELIGCARSQRDVARLIAALGDIDGVTRVTAANSAKPDSAATGSTGGTDQVTDECRTRDFIARFEIVAAFDGVAPPAGATGAPVPVAPPGAVPASAPAPSDGGVAGAEQARALGKGNVDAAADDVTDAKNIVPEAGG